MTAPSIDAYVRLDTHLAHPSAVTATLTGTQHRTAHALLTTRGFETIDEHTLVLARIDHEESQWRSQVGCPQALTPTPTALSVSLAY
ncbi:hypothetical protein ACIHAR_39100 [Streptomyces sp. NPDC052016]|uniref:hypothetical protein n=1 Tax=Streptomyces sp. NPDC052016 TaxID=3365680 RepID=UPI0037D7BEA1